MTRNVVIVGSGSLAHSICYSLAAILHGPCRIVICARSREKCDEIQHVARAKAALLGSDLRFDTFLFDAETGDPDELIASLEPELLLNCTSYHSPWERLSNPSCWTDLLAQTGFGMTLPLQAALAIRLARAAAESSSPPLFINGCYPDAVNPVLRTLNLPVLCGVGNVSVIASSLLAALGLVDRRRLRVLAHHLHLNPLKPGSPEARAWVDGIGLRDVGDRLKRHRATDGLEMNKLIGFSAAVLLRDILSGGPVETCIPGPYGLPGGYPVVIEGRRLTLNLPDGISEAEAIAWNESCAVADGVRVLPEGWIEFSPEVSRPLAQYLPAAAGGFPASRISDVSRSMLQLREQLRNIPAARPQTMVAEISRR